MRRINSGTAVLGNINSPKRWHVASSETFICVAELSSRQRRERGRGRERGREGREKDGRVYELVGGFGGAVALQHLKAENLCLHEVMRSKSRGSSNAWKPDSISWTASEKDRFRVCHKGSFSFFFKKIVFSLGEGGNRNPKDFKEAQCRGIPSVTGNGC